MQSEHRHSQLTGVLAGLWCVLVGVAMMAVWLAEPVSFAERYPGFFGMKFNAAFAFLLIGIALLLALARYHVLPILLTVPVFVYGTLALSQHLFGLDLGIDELFHRPFVDIGTSVPGRIAPNTALCFMLVSLAVMLRALRGGTDVLQIACAYISVVIAATSLVGYIVALEGAHDWIDFTRMSLQSASCFLAIGIGILYSGPRSAGRGTAIAVSLAVATYLVLLSLAYVKVQSQMLAPLPQHPEALATTATTILNLILISGAIYVGLLAYSYWTSKRYRQSTSVLGESQRRLAAIIDHAIAGILTIGEDGTILSANPACQQIFGYPPAALIGRSVKMLLPEAERTAGGDVLRTKLLAGGEREARRQDGSTVPIDISVARVELSDGTIYTAIIRDISERKHFEQQLLTANAELEEFAYRTSHDLRSPIASSIGLLNISRELLENGEYDALGSTLGRMERNFNRLDGLIQNIIVLTRDRLLDEEDQTILVHDVVQSQADTLANLETENRVRIGNYVDPQLTIRNKPSKFEVIVGNLLSNAIKYHDPQEPEPRVDIYLEERPGSVRLIVEDNGIGVPEEKRQFLFRMFKRLHPSRSFGSGLGLYILKKSAESLGGTATYEPKEKGSRFIVELPNEDGGT